MTFKIAQSATLEAVHAGDLAELAHAFINSYSNDLKSGCIMALFECLSALKAAGIACTWPDDERATAFMKKTTARIQAEVLIHINSPDESSWRLTAIVGYINANAARLSFTTPAPQPVPQPMPVHVVAMPQRVSHQTVERDENDEIISTTKIEKDFA